VAPLANARTNTVTGLEHQRLDATRDEVRRGRQPDGTRADDGDREVFLGLHLLLLTRSKIVDGM
jgi:hypothetical protein